MLGAELLERRSGLHVIQQLCHAPRLWPRLREERAIITIFRMMEPALLAHEGRYLA